MLQNINEINQELLAMHIQILQTYKYLFCFFHSNGREY